MKRRERSIKKVIIAIVAVMCLASCGKNEIKPGKYFSGSFDATFDYVAGKDTLSGFVGRTAEGEYTMSFYYPDSIKNLKMTYYMGGITITYGEMRYDIESKLNERAVITVFAETAESIINGNSLRGRIKESDYKVRVENGGPAEISFTDGRKFIIRDYVKNA